MEMPKTLLSQVQLSKSWLQTPILIRSDLITDALSVVSKMVQYSNTELIEARGHLLSCFSTVTGRVNEDDPLQSKSAVGLTWLRDLLCRFSARSSTIRPPFVLFTFSTALILTKSLDSAVIQASVSEDVTEEAIDLWVYPGSWNSGLY